MKPPTPPRTGGRRPPSTEAGARRPGPPTLPWTLSLPPVPLEDPDGRIDLPPPRLETDTPLERLLRRRRSVREYTDTLSALTLAAAGQLLWAAQGVTDRKRDLRAAPSAGACHPLELYLVTGMVEGLPPGVYRYRAREHALRPTTEGDLRAALSDAARCQRWVRDAAGALVLAADDRRSARRYGERGRRYVDMEVGAAMENVYLQATALGLATAAVGAFHDDRVAEVLGLPADQRPCMVMPVGRPRVDSGP